MQAGSLGPSKAGKLQRSGCLRWGGGDGSSQVKTGCSDGAGVSAQLWDLSLASDLILPGPKPRQCLCQLPCEESGVLWGGQVWAEMCVAAIMSGQSLKGLSTGQNVRRKASSVLWPV